MSVSAPFKSNQNGFSLIELLLVVVIVAILSAVAVPTLLKAKRAAETGSVIGTLRTLSTHQMAFMTVNGRYARITELNTFTNNSLGTTSSRSVYRGDYRFRNYPSSNPSDTTLKQTYGFRVTRTENFFIVFEIIFTNTNGGEFTIIQT